MITPIALGFSLAMIGVGVLAIIFSGIKNIINGKVDLKKIITVAIPFVVFGIAYGVMGTLTQAGIATMLFMIAVMALLIAVSGLRSTFNI